MAKCRPVREAANDRGERFYAKSEAHAAFMRIIQNATDDELNAIFRTLMWLRNSPKKKSEAPRNNVLQLFSAKGGAA